MATTKESSATASTVASTAKSAAENADQWARRARQNGGEDVAAQLDLLREDFLRLSESVSLLVQNQASDLGDKVREKVDHARGQVNDLGARGRDMANRAQRQAVSMTRDVETTIEQNPMTAVLCALGIGFLAGLISRNR